MTVDIIIIIPTIEINIEVDLNNLNLDFLIKNPHVFTKLKDTIFNYMILVFNPLPTSAFLEI